jgi:tetratricopeptide (TPR) repeat protein
VSSPPRELSRRKKILFRITAILLPVVALVLVELGFRLFESGESSRDRHVNISPFSIFTRVRAGGEDYYRITHRYAYAERKISFRVRKPAKTIRIICLGGSACASWPHPAQETFDRYLEQGLQSAFPHLNVEVINAAAHGFASYRVRHVFDEVIRLEPDALVIYSGNNEFLEDREYDTSGRGVVDALSDHLRVVRWLQSALGRTRTELSGDELNNVARFFWSKVKREALELRRDPAKFRQVQAHYAESIEYMVGEAGRRRVNVLLCTVPVNLRDWMPTVSVHRLEGQARDDWRRRYLRGRRGLLTSSFGEGIRWLSEAIELEPEHAESRFWMGRLLESEGRRSEALESYVRAKDLDYNPFRAHSAFNRTVRRIAAQNDHAILVDLEAAFAETSGAGVPGFDLFLDYVHPNKRGNLLIARRVFEAIVAHDAVRQEPRDRRFIREDRPLPSGGKPYHEPTDLRLQRRLFNLYAMNHQYDAAIAKALDLVRLETGRPAGDDPEELPAALHPKPREGYAAFRLHQRVLRREILGEPVDPREKAAAERALAAFYDKWYEYGTF